MRLPSGKPPAPVGAPREGTQVVEMQRRRLFFALGEVIDEGGLEGVTVGRLCTRAGVSRRTFYELFADREACLLAAVEHAVERVRAKLPTRERSQAWRDCVRAGLAAILEQMDAEPQTARLCLVEAPRAGVAVQGYRRRLLDEIAIAVEEGRAEAGGRSEPPSPLTAQGIVGGVLAVVQEHLLSARDGSAESFVALTGPLMAMIVHPYLGAAAARRELELPPPSRPNRSTAEGSGPFAGLPIRFTYRTARVLATIAGEPGASNRHIGETAGIADQGQISRLLQRLNRSGLIENGSAGGPTRGEPNAWKLTGRGAAIHAAIATDTPEH